MVRVQFLGSGDAFGSGGRFQACIHVHAPYTNLLLDCGASSVIAMKRFGVAPNDIDAILISHVHGDHFGGIPFFILDAQFLSRLALEGVKTFRYVATTTSAVWGTGSLEIDFLAFATTGEGWQDSRGNMSRAGTDDDREITVQGPTGQLADPLSGSGIDVNVLNGRNYMDVTLPGAPTGYTIESRSVLDLAPEFRLSGDALGTVVLDNSQAPVHLTGNQYRYWINGLFIAPLGMAVGQGVTITFLPGSVSYVPTTAPTASPTRRVRRAARPPVPRRSTST